MELTPNGFSQERLLGVYLRDKYVKGNNSFLPKMFKKEEFDIKGI